MKSNYISAKKKSVSLDTLCEVFNVSKNTVRRDIATLEQSGKIKKVYGGVTIADTPASKTLLPFSKRHQSFYEREATNQPVSCISCL